ncbi:MAG: hypothetical protein V2A74_07400, partial [bacterium]
ARRAADFALAHLRDSDGRLLKRYRAGHAGLPSTIEDYSFMIWGLIELYEATFDVKYLEAAIKLNDTAIAHYWDKANGGFFLTADDSEQLLVRNKEIYDGAVPSGNSVAALNLLRLGRITANKDYKEKAFALQKAFSENIRNSPVAFAQSLVALDFALGPTQEIVIAGDAASSDTQAMAKLIRTRFLPRVVLLHRPPRRRRAHCRHRPIHRVPEAHQRQGNWLRLRKLRLQAPDPLPRPTPQASAGLTPLLVSPSPSLRVPASPPVPPRRRVPTSPPSLSRFHTSYF